MLFTTVQITILRVQNVSLLKGVCAGAIHPMKITSKSCKTDCYRIQHAINEICDLVSHPNYATFGDMRPIPLLQQNFSVVFRFHITSILFVLRLIKSHY